MSKIYCKLFGIPQVEIDGTKVFFPYAKINALIYYILVNKMVSRDEIAGLLWPEENEKVAKKNLRNALYQAKKTLDCEFIVSPKKSILVLNEDLDITTDIDLFLKDPEKNLPLYSGDFLNGFFLKEAESYEYWITKMRNYYQEEFINTCYEKISKDIDTEDYTDVEKNINRLIEIDEFDERNYQLLMQFYQKIGRHEKVIETYYDISKSFQEELGVDPDPETKTIYEKSLEQISNTNQHKVFDSFFYGRYEEIAEIEHNILNFKNGSPSKNIIVYGEAGIGKSALKRKILSNKYEDFNIIETYCYQAEENYALRPFSVLINQLSELLNKYNIPKPTFWNETFSKILPDFDDSISSIKLLESKEFLKFDLLTKAVVDTIQTLSEKKKLILIFEDIQWMDPTSLELLTSIMLHLNNETIFLATCRRQFNANVDDLVSSLTRYDKILNIKLDRFNKIESEQFIRKALPDKSLNHDEIDKIYSETDGNSFFLSEYVNVIKSGKNTNLMTSKMMDTIKSRFMYLSNNEKILLDIVSFFYDEAPLEIVCEITNFTELDIIQLLENLENRNILTEGIHKNHISLLFTHTKLREYIYMNQSNSKKKILHKKIAEILERQLENRKKSPYLYSKLIYHFSAAGDEPKALKYKIETLNYYLSFSHELFPILNISEVVQSETMYISRDKIQEMFENLEDTFKALKASSDDPELNQLEIEFYYMKGRYLIRDGNYEDGISAIKYIINRAKELDNKDYVLEGYKQMIFYNVQTNNASAMQEYIELALDLAVKCNYHKEIGIILRLKGLYNIMVGNYFLAEKLFNESINIFNVTEEVANRYAINIAASYNYIGEIRFATGEYDKTTDQFVKAIELSKGKNALSSLSVFYINAGKSCYIQGHIKDAESFFNKAYELYGQFDSFWKRPVLDSYMALTQMALGNIEKSKDYLKNAINFADKMKNPRDLGAVYFAEYLILDYISDKEELKDFFKEIFNYNIETIKEKALECLDKHRDCYEINTIIFNNKH